MRPRSQGNRGASAWRTEMNRAADSRVLYKYVTRKQTENVCSFSPSFSLSLSLSLSSLLSCILFFRLDSISSHFSSYSLSCTPIVARIFPPHLLPFSLSLLLSLSLYVRRFFCLLFKCSSSPVRQPLCLFRKKHLRCSV